MYIAAEGGPGHQDGASTADTVLPLWVRVGFWFPLYNEQWLDKHSQEPDRLYSSSGRTMSKKNYQIICNF